MSIAGSLSHAPGSTKISGACISSRNRLPLEAIGSVPPPIPTRTPHTNQPECMYDYHTTGQSCCGHIFTHEKQCSPSERRSTWKALSLTYTGGTVDRRDKSVNWTTEERYPRDDLNVRHTAPEAVALSGLSYGGTDDSHV